MRENLRGTKPDLSPLPLPPTQYDLAFLCFAGAGVKSHGRQALRVDVPIVIPPRSVPGLRSRGRVSRGTSKVTTTPASATSPSGRTGGPAWPSFTRPARLPAAMFLVTPMASRHCRAGSLVPRQARIPSLRRLARFREVQSPSTRRDCPHLLLRCRYSQGISRLPVLEPRFRSSLQSS